MKNCIVCNINIPRNRKYCNKCGYEVNSDEIKISNEIKKIECFSKLIIKMKDNYKTNKKKYSNTICSRVKISEGQRMKVKSLFKDLWRDL